MATFEDNEKAEKTEESTTPMLDSSSNKHKSSTQPSLFNRLFSKKDSSNLTSGKSIANASSVCPQCTADEKNRLASHPTSSGPDSSTSLHHCAHNHNSQTLDHSFDGQNRATAVSTSSDEREITQEEQPEIPTSTTTKSKRPTKVSKAKQSSTSKTTEPTANPLASSTLIEKQTSWGSRISQIFRFLCFCCFPSSKQDATIESTPQIEIDQENHGLSDNRVNHNDDQRSFESPDHNESHTNDIEIDQTSLESPGHNNYDTNSIEVDQTPFEAPDHNKCDTNDIVIEQTTSSILCIDTPQPDIVEQKEENANMLSVMNTAEDLYLSASDEEDDDHDEILIESKKPIGIIEEEANNRKIADPVIPQDDQVDKFKTKQAELKGYYEKFPNIKDAMDETGPDIRKAKALTESILGKPPSGNVNDTNTVCHVLNQLFKNEHRDCLFFDSKNGINLHDSSQNIVDVNSHNRPFVLKLSSSEGLGNTPHGTTEQDDFRLVQTLTNVIEEERSHPVLEDIIERLAKAHGVRKEDIVIENLYVGTLNVVYSVRDPSENNVLPTKDIEQDLKKQFPQCVGVKMHPLLHRASFDISDLDSRGNKRFLRKSETFKVGPLGREQSYTTPSGWVRYGLKVLGRFEDDYWLDPFRHPRNWYRAFHGTGHATKADFSNTDQSFDANYACVTALYGIYRDGFHKARTAAYGPGVYCSPDPKLPENRYVRAVSLKTEQGLKSFKCMLQVAVNPDSVKIKSSSIWVVPEPKDIRPYGILIKEG